MFKYITIAPGGPVTVHEQDHPLTLAEMQAVVGGFIEAFWVVGSDDHKTIDCYCNEEGKLTGLDVNVYWPAGQDLIRGAVLIVGGDPHNGDNRSLTDGEIARVKLVDTGVRERGVEITVLAPGQAPPEARKLYALMIDDPA